MFTDRYCPICKLKLKELRGPRGEYQGDEIYCKNQHVWKWTVRDYEVLSRRNDDNE